MTHWGLAPKGLSAPPRPACQSRLICAKIRAEIGKVMMRKQSTFANGNIRPASKRVTEVMEVTEVK